MSWIPDPLSPRTLEEVVRRAETKRREELEEQHGYDSSITMPTRDMVEKFIQESFPPGWSGTPGRREPAQPETQAPAQPGGYTFPLEQSIDSIISEVSPDVNRHHNLHNLHSLTSAYYRDLANKYHALGDKKSADEHELLSYQHGVLAKTHKALFDILSARENQ